MPSPFPGKDPYLEDPTHWPGVHANFIVAFQELLNQQIRPKYVAQIESAFTWSRTTTRTTNSSTVFRTFKWNGPAQDQRKLALPGVRWLSPTR